MNILIILTASLALITLSESIDTVQIDKSCGGSTDFRKLSHCITKRQTNRSKPCPLANNANGCPLTRNGPRCPLANNAERCSYNTPCDNRQSCNRCNDCERDTSVTRESTSNTRNDNNVTNENNMNIQQRSDNKNTQDNKVHVNLINTVHNINNISNPVSITNVNHFFYNGSVTKSSKCQNGEPCQRQVDPIRPPPCMQNRIRAPIILPPYIPPPSPCFRQQQFPYIGCNQQPAPYVTQSK